MYIYLHIYIHVCIYNHLFYIILNVFAYISKSYGIPYYMNVICAACYLFLSFVKMVWWWSIDRNKSSR